MTYNSNNGSAMYWVAICDSVTGSPCPYNASVCLSQATATRAGVYANVSLGVTSTEQFTRDAQGRAVYELLFCSLWLCVAFSHFFTFDAFAV